MPDSKFLRIKLSDDDKHNRALFDSEFNKFFKNDKLDRTIYIITVGKFKYSSKDIMGKFEILRYKNREGGKIHISKINELNFDCQVNSNIVLYVGSKYSDTKSRILQHLGLNTNSKGEKGCRTIYSLFMSEWFDDRNATIKIEILKFDEKIAMLELELLEDFLWEGLKPLFGKKGATFNRKAVS